jgi:hypothetical protein
MAAPTMRKASSSTKPERIRTNRATASARALSPPVTVRSISTTAVEGGLELDASAGPSPVAETGAEHAREAAAKHRRGIVRMGGRIGTLRLFRLVGLARAGNPLTLAHASARG